MVHKVSFIILLFALGTFFLGLMIPTGPLQGVTIFVACVAAYIAGITAIIERQ